jgi:hypothetical protein
MNGDEALDYVRAMAYGPSQNEYTHDTLYGPLGRLQPGDVAISPNLQKKYPIGSSIYVTPKTGNPFVARVADHSYFHPGEPTKDTIEVWNGQDLGHAHITSAPAGARPQIQGSALLGYGLGPEAGAAGASLGAGGAVTPSVPPPVASYAYGGGSSPMMSSWGDYGRAMTGPTDTQKGIAAVGQGIAQAGQAFAQGQAGASKQSDAMVNSLLAQRSPFAAYLQSLLMRPTLT